MAITVDGGGQATLPLYVPGPSLIGSTLYAQFVTFPGGVTLIDEVSNLLAIPLVGGP